MNLSLFLTGGWGSLWRPTCHCFACHPWGEEGGCQTQYAQCHSIYRFWVLTAPLSDYRLSTLTIFYILLLVNILYLPTIHEILDYLTIFSILRKTLLKKRKEEQRQRVEWPRIREHLIDYYRATWIQLLCELAFIGKSLHNFF